MSLSIYNFFSPGNLVPSSRPLRELYSKIKKKLNKGLGWSIVVTHFDDETRTFYNDFISDVSAEELVEYVIDEGIHKKENTGMWLWSCNAGYTDEQNGIPAIAQEIADYIDGTVKAAPAQ